MNELPNTLNKITAEFDEDAISGFERRIKFQEKLLNQSIAFRKECVEKGFIELIPDYDKKIEFMREKLASLREEMIQAIEST